MVEVVVGERRRSPGKQEVRGLAGQRERRPGRDDPHHLERDPVQHQAAPQRRGLGAEVLAPQGMADHRHVNAARSDVGRAEIASQLQPEPDGAGQARGGHQRLQLPGLTAQARRQAIAPVASEGLERRGIPSDLLQVLPAQWMRKCSGLGPRAESHRDQPSGVRERQRAEQQGVDDGEERRIGAEPDGQRGDDRQAQAWKAPQLAERGTEVASEAVHQPTHPSERRASRGRPDAAGCAPRGVRLRDSGFRSRSPEWVQPGGFRRPSVPSPGACSGPSPPPAPAPAAGRRRRETDDPSRGRTRRGLARGRR